MRLRSKRLRGAKQALCETASAQQEAQVLQAKGQKRPLILQAGGARGQILQRRVKAEAIQTVFSVINAGKATPELLFASTWRCCRRSPGWTGVKLWMVPSDLTGAQESISKGFRSGQVGGTMPGRPQSLRSAVNLFKGRTPVDSHQGARAARLRRRTSVSSGCGFTDVAGVLKSIDRASWRTLSLRALVSHAAHARYDETFSCCRGVPTRTVARMFCDVLMPMAAQPSDPARRSRASSSAPPTRGSAS